MVKDIYTREPGRIRVPRQWSPVGQGKILFDPLGNEE